MFESTPDERMKAFVRRNGAVTTKGGLTPEMIRRYTKSITFQSTLMKEFTNVLDYGKDVYCPSCAIPESHGAVTAWPLIALLDKNPMADTGEMLSFTCLHCGFVEHHKAPKMPLAKKVEDRVSDAIRYAEYQRMMAKHAQMGARYSATEMQRIQMEMERLSGMAGSPPPPVAAGLAQSLEAFVKKHGGTY